jgi:hypothetical protein
MLFRYLITVLFHLLISMRFILFLRIFRRSQGLVFNNLVGEMHCFIELKGMLIAEGIIFCMDFHIDDIYFHRRD